MRVSPDNKNAKYLKGLIDRRKGELQKLLNLNPNNAKAFQALGNDAEVAVMPEGPVVLPLLEN